MGSGSLARGSGHRRGTRAQRAEALAHIAEVHRTHDRAGALARDPVQFPRGYHDSDDREVAALLAALLAFGNVETIGAKLRTLFALLDDKPGRAARQWGAVKLERALSGFRHRTFRGEDIARLLFAAGTLMARDGRLYASLERAFARTGTLRGALVEFTSELRSIAWPAGPGRLARHLLPDPEGPSACKRLLLLSRWLARPDDGVDLGLIALPTRALVIPLDVHVHRVALSLGLTTRKSASWLAAEDVTEALRALDPEDPVRFDFAVCHAEIAAYRRDRRAAQSPDSSE